jgi:hypothetical protein
MLAALKDALNVLRHNLSHIIDLFLRRPQGVLLACIRAALLRHQPLQCAIETRASIRWQMCEIRLFGIKLGEEFLLEIGKEAKRDALAELALGNDEEGEAACAGLARWEVRGRLDEAVGEVLVLVDCAVRGGFVLEGWEDDGDERGGIGRGRSCVFGEDRGVVGYTSAGNIKYLYG